MNGPLPSDKPIFAYYGDDFTGSTDALEALAVNGVETVLFLKTPDDGNLRSFHHCRAIGIAGDSRSRTPDWMSEELPGIFRRLREIGALVMQYKVCSTFDSSPAVGSIGRTLEIGLEVFGKQWAPVVPAAPLLQRYVIFGNMFAADNGVTYRIDRHPTMKNHPVTPMQESDLRLHLARQTALSVGLVDFLSLRARKWELPEGAKAILFDGLETADLARTAQLLWETRATQQIFAVGSSGFTYGMLDYWRSQGWLPEPGPRTPTTAADRILVLSGSCSPATERQICTALRSGFHGIRLDTGQSAWPDAQGEAINQLAAGRSVILYSALGGADHAEVTDRQNLAASMGRLLRNVIEGSGVGRVAVAGGDTSSHAVRELNLTALTYAAPLSRGVPLCRAHGWNGGLDLALKGGQVGSDNFFQEVMSCA